MWFLITAVLHLLLMLHLVAASRGDNYILIPSDTNATFSIQKSVISEAGHAGYLAIVTGGISRFRVAVENSSCGVRKTSALAAKFGCTYAVNGGPFSSYIHGGCVGAVIADGMSIAKSYDGDYVAFGSTVDREWFLGKVSNETEALEGLGVRNLVTGLGGWLVRDGRVITEKGGPSAPRTAVGVRATGELVILQVDGCEHCLDRSKRGLTLFQMARLLASPRVGASHAINLDGGGSSTTVDGNKIINHPTCLDYVDVRRKGPNKKLSSKDSRDSILWALAQYEKRLRRLAYDELPLEICRGQENLDLSLWTLVVTDKCLARIAGEYCGDIQDSSTVSKTNETQNKPYLRSFDLSGGDKITDYGLRCLADICPELSRANLDNVFQITEKGLMHLAKACRKIFHLSLSGCLGISGTGFAILGQYTQQLRTLRVSGCRRLTPWAFMKIFQGCRHLEEVDVSYCSLITDQEIKLLSDYCAQLKRLDLKECRQISDVGLLSLSQGCKKLEYLDLARNGMVSKITDVSLLAIGEGCEAIMSLNLSGCEMITDAGISWLAKGCKQLRSINASNCSKVTNGGMRSLGEECSQLRNITITNMKKVSDVGLRYLSEGCDLLEHLNASGLYMLSDGVNRNFGFEGVQALSKAKCARTIRSINLHGCFQIRDVAVRSLAAMKSLESLVLSGCTALNAEGMIELAKSCSKLTTLSLSSCGDCVSNAMLEGMARYLVSIETLNLAGCGKIGRKGLGALSKCTKLLNLDLSGCTCITNDAILSICEGTFCPGLRSLSLERCRNVSDAALTWIVDGLQDFNGDFAGDVTLLKLALKGTKITLPAVKAIRERFRYSDIKTNDSYFGFIPLSRPDHRKIINLHGKKSEAAAKIQAIFRARKDAEIVQKARERYCTIKIATKIASLWRGRTTRLHYKELKSKHWTERLMANKIQCWFRCLNAKKVARRLRHKRWMLVAPFAANEIQRVYRGIRGRKDALRAKIEQETILRRKEEACILIQSVGRMYMCICLRKELLLQLQAYEYERNKCTIKIQSIWRMNKGKNLAGAVRKFLQQEIERKNNASHKIFKFIRLQHFRGLVLRKVQLSQNRHRKALQIQTWLRERNIIIQHKLMEAEIDKQTREDAAIVMQKTWRRKVSYILASMKRKEKHDIDILKGKKGFILTSWWRCCLARHHVNLLRLQRVEEMKQQVKVEVWAATTIAAFWRGEKGREKALLAIHAKKSRWKQMWSEEKGRPFYYNQFTGESRWRKPQDLLDLEDKPICSNCTYFEAQIECADCCEFFCNTCWDAVHFGGRRKSHKFRSLYDYYGKRVDYGDYYNEDSKQENFPCLWPTEVEQNDRLGWQLRVAPYRSPSRQVDGVNVYHDDESNRIFYHDERSNQRSYFEDCIQK